MFPSNDCEDVAPVGIVVVDVVDVVGVVDVVEVVVVHMFVDVGVLVVVDVAALMTDVGSDVATAEPFLLLAVTVTRSVAPMSFAPSSCVWLVAPATGEQAAPLEVQRAHWNE